MTYGVKRPAERAARRRAVGITRVRFRERLKAAIKTFARSHMRR